jgi:hypothetical protein
MPSLQDIVTISIKSVCYIKFPQNQDVQTGDLFTIINLKDDNVISTGYKLSFHVMFINHTL